MLSKPLECTTPKVKPNVLWTLGDNTVSIKFNKCNILVGDVDAGGWIGGREQEVDGKSLYLPFNFAVNLKLL